MMDRMYGETQASKFGYANSATPATLRGSETETDRILMRIEELDKRLSDLVSHYGRINDRMLGASVEKMPEEAALNKVPVINGVVGEIWVRMNDLNVKIKVLEGLAQRLSTL